MPRRMAGGFRPQMRSNSPRRNPSQNPAQGFMAPPMMPQRAMAPEVMQPKMQSSMAPLSPPMPQISQSPMVPQQKMQGEGRLLPPMIAQPPPMMKSQAFDSSPMNNESSPITPPQMSPIHSSLMTALNGGGFEGMNARGPAPMINSSPGEGENYSQMRRGFGRLGLP